MTISLSVSLFALAQTQKEQTQTEPVQKKTTENTFADPTFPEVPVYPSPNKRTGKQVAQQNTVAPRMDPVAVGLSSKPITNAALRSLALSPDEKLLAIGTGSGEIAIWDIAKNRFQTRWKAHENWVFDLVIDEKKNRLISGGGDNYTKVWQVGTWKRLYEFQDHKDDVHGIASTEDGQTFITGGDDAQVLVREVFTGKISELKGHTAQVTSVVKTPDEKRILTGSRDETIRVWDLKKLQEIAVLQGHTEDVLHLAINSSGKHVASASYDGTVRVWSLNDFSLVKQFAVEKVRMLSVEFSQDGSMVFTGSSDGILRAWDIKSGEKLWEVQLNSDISDLVRTRDGKRLFASTADQGVSSLQVSKGNGIVTQSITVNVVSSPRPQQLTNQEYLDMHEALLFHQQDQDWSQRVGLLALHGDQFTYHLLKEMKRDHLPAPKREMAKRLTETLTDNYAPFEDFPLNEQTLARFWQRFTLSLVQIKKIQASLDKWLIDQTKRTIANSEDLDELHKQCIEAVKKAAVDSGNPEISQSVIMKLNPLFQTQK